MGFQGQLSSVNLTDIFQTLHMNHQTGTLTVSGGVGGSQHIYFDQGQVAMCSAPLSDGRPFLITALMRKNLLSVPQADELAARLAASRQPVRDLVDASGYVSVADLDETCSWCIEEIICPVFEWRQGDFTFSDGAPTGELLAPGAIATGEVRLQTTQLVLEATRRDDEWKRIRDVIPEPEALYIVDNDGRANLRNIESDPEIVKVLRYLDGRHTIEAISEAVGVTRFDTFAIVAQLVLNNVARLRGPQELVEDAAELRSQGDLAKAHELLENIARQAHVPEVIRPLAEVCAELKLVPRAVELYLELIQVSQDQGQLEPALADLDTVIGLSPDDPDLHFDRAQVLTELNRAEDAAQAYVSAATAYLATRDIPQAIDACHRAKNLLPRVPDPHRWLAKAYLMDGQTENAVIEYKSLWHSLLSNNRPRKALEVLKQTLDNDCKFPAVKEQVINHAQSSEAVKTGNATRLLIYALSLIAIGCFALYGWKVIQNEFVKNHGLEDLQAIKADLDPHMGRLLHAQLIERLKKLGNEYSRFSDITYETDHLIQRILADQEQRAADELKLAEAYFAADEFAKAAEAYRGLIQRFPAAKAAVTAADGQRKADLGVSTKRFRERLEQARQAWQDDDWDGAQAKLQPLLAEKDLPATVRQEVQDTAKGWADLIGQAEAWFRRAERLQQRGRKKESMQSFREAIKAPGETWQMRAQERLTSLERQFAEELAKTATEAFARADDKQAFTAVDDLRLMVKDSFTKEPAKCLAKLPLPFTITLDSPHAWLAVKRAGSEDSVVRAPAGTTGAWTNTFTYSDGQTVTAEARRAGFTSQQVIFNAEGRRSTMAIVLKRGWLWQAPLGGRATTTPVASGRFVLIGTNKPSLAMVDTGLGTATPLSLPDSVSELGASPFVFSNHAYLVLDDRIIALNTNTRTVSWTYPSTSGGISPIYPPSLWVQDHELIQGNIQVFAATLGGKLLSLGVTGDTVTAYPAVQLDSALTGSPMVDHFDGRNSTLYVPSGPRLVAFDATSVSEQSPLRQLYAVRSKGDLVGTPVRALVAGRPAILVTDSSGVVIAIDADPSAPSANRTISSWSLEGTATHAPAYVVGQPRAYIAVSEGRVLALDLAQSSSLTWRYPAQGTLGTLPGAPAIGQRGVYIADGKGILYCIDHATGTERWRADLGSPVVTGIFAHEGRIYVPIKGDSLVCFEEGE